MQLGEAQCRALQDNLDPVHQQAVQTVQAEHDTGQRDLAADCSVELHTSVSGSLQPGPQSTSHSAREVV
ncbi:hypothetical protein WJX72_010507 [[Myrmecia] bisecta]|uniref:Uncharacterized protein n=1 Tax=[Myrmecia] bisecta TaxID=41462 RepID=A0AAW1R9B8_9CHLO